MSKKCLSTYGRTFENDRWKLSESCGQDATYKTVDGKMVFCTNHNLIMNGRFGYKTEKIEEII